MKKVTKGFLLIFKGVHIVLPVKHTYMTKDVRLNLSTLFLNYVRNNKQEMLSLLNITEHQLNTETFDAMTLDKELCIPMYDMKFIIDNNVVTLNYKKRAAHNVVNVKYEFGKLRIINV